MSDISYIGEEFIDTILPVIDKLIPSDELFPSYVEELNAVNQLRKVLLLAQEDYYETIHQKAAYIMTAIAGSQYFSNGNKRLSLLLISVFYLHNDYALDADKLLDNKSLFDLTTAYLTHIFVSTNLSLIYSLTKLAADSSIPFNKRKELLAQIFQIIWVKH